MTKFNPKVSIVIPVFNGSKYLKEAINSALAQTYSNIEVIVVNDGSTDDGRTDKIAKSYGKKIKYYQKESGGLASALNLGIEKMTGQYFSWMSHDDIYYPDKTKVQVKFLNHKKNHKTVVYSDYAIYNMLEDIERGVKIPNTFKNRAHYLLLEENLVGRTALIPKEAFEQCGAYDVHTNTVYDYEMWQRVAKAGYTFIHQDAIFARKRVYKTPAQLSVLAQNETERLVLGYIESFDQDEMVQLDGSEYNFYIQNKVCLRKQDLPKVHAFLDKKIQYIESAVLSKIKQTKAKITALTPVYNRAKLVAEVLDSVAAQTYKDFVYIILDDGSVDNSGEVVSRYIANKENWFYLYHENIGEAKTVNKGWNLCYSEYFVQVNSDDPVKPNLFQEMSKALDKRPDCVLGYPDFDIVDGKNKLIEEVRSPDYNFLKDLSEFSCYAASPGAFMRKSAVPDIKTLKDSRFRHTNDIKMLWNLALRGEFLHVPQTLAYWRAHEGGISSTRYEAIPEIATWIKEYFSQPLPKAVKDIEPVCMRSIYNYFASLMEASDQPNKMDSANYYREKAKLPLPSYSNLQVGDNDLIGNKFNGHDLHINLRQKGVEAYHLVWNKQSQDPNTYVIAGDNEYREELKGQTVELQTKYDLDNIHNPFTYDVMYNKLFLDADVVHLHLLHNGLWDLNLLPIMSQIKPIVWTIHDMWVASGHPHAAERPDYYLPLHGIKNGEFNFALKQASIKNANLTLIVASKYMERAIREYDMFKDKKIHYIPFGLDFDMFYPRDRKSVREKLGIGLNEKVILARGDNRYKKGLDYIEYLAEHLLEPENVHLLIVGGNELAIDDRMKSTYFGWVNDDERMAEFYSAADIFLMPSTVEPFGMMAIEAMACGTLPIVLEGTALPDTVNAPDCGIATKQDPNVYCDAVEYYLTHNVELEKRKKACVAYVREKHDMDRYLSALDNVYKQVVADHTESKESKALLASLKANNQIAPALNLAPQQVHVRLGYLSRLKRVVKDRGATTAVRLLTKKSASRLRRVTDRDYVGLIRKYGLYIKRHGLLRSTRKAAGKMKAKLRGR